MKTIFFTDLDDTLFATTRKQPLQKDFRLATTLKDGSASAYQSPKQQQFLQLWQKNALIIPVTARGYDAFTRVQLEFDSYAVINHGGMILDNNGEIYQEWHKLQQQNSAKTTEWLEKQQEHLINIAKQLNADIRIKINSDYNLNLYVLLKSNTNNEQMLQKIVKIYQTQYADELNSTGYIHINANNLAILPNWLNKQYAVKFLQQKFSEEYGEFLSIGCGDSLSDINFMQCCDFWIAPSNSQICQEFRI